VNAVLPAPRHTHPRDWWQSSSTLVKALVVSVAIHAVLLMVRIAAPEVFEIKRPIRSSTWCWSIRNPR
jgi:protein TonB